MLKSNVNFIIREMKKSEYQMLEKFLYEAIFIPNGAEMPPKSITSQPELQVYISDFGRQDDNCLVAEVEGKVIGAAWSRIMKDYGHVDDTIPSFAISLYKEYRGLGIGTELVKAMLSLLHDEGSKKISLSVQKKNFAVQLYERTGFQIIAENEEEYIMVCNL